MKRLMPALAACLGVIALSAPAEAAPARNPVVFVHGYGGSAGDIAAVRPALLAAGYTETDLHSLDFPNGETNETTARRLATHVDGVLANTGASKVDIIGFSMGGLSSRYYLKNLGGDAKVAHFAGISVPNHGTWYANWCWLVTSDRACSQMAPRSTFLTALNSGDETPGAVAYATWVSRCDDVVSPPESTFLTGAANHWTAGCLAHNATPGAAEVTSGVIAFFQAG
ncbi:esterase/lipase family protein [Actinokineospora soli]|uniref:Esterase/lipase family protein n=1 Tax=Actinokineospora soli TaxID=1048753 RepID=A0ABW2TPA0_9PSEU